MRLARDEEGPRKRKKRRWRDCDSEHVVSRLSTANCRGKLFQLLNQFDVEFNSSCANIVTRLEFKSADAAAAAAAADDDDDDATIDRPASKKEDVTGQDDAEAKSTAEPTFFDGDTTTVTIADTPTAKNKSSRRRSVGGGLSRKGSKARLTHTDAKPGDHFLVKLKGFPAWPAIICDEDMLPHALVTSRPVSAARPDGTYSEPFADGGKRVNDRTFPVMYLHTNEFGWEKNTNLSELGAEKAKDTINDKMRKDLKAAYELAIEQHPVDYYKDILKTFQEELMAQEEAARQAAATPKKGKKGKNKATEEEDTEMVDVDASAKKSKKRKAEDEVATPQRTDSVKKPKIKLNTSSTPKATNGAAAALKVGGGSAAKGTKAKAKKDKDATTKEGGEKKSESSKESKMSPEERHKRKVKEVLFLRHKLQKGLLTREQKPKEEEMQSMSDFITILEKFGNLEVSIIRETKINKVLKAILKLVEIPREEEFHFKKRSQTLLDKWNKLLAGDTSGNVVNGNADGHGEGKKDDSNGVKADGEAKAADPATESEADKTEAAEPAAAKVADE